MAQSNESGSQSSEDNSDNRRRRGPRRNFFGDSLGGGGSGFFSGITTIKIPGSNNDIDLKDLGRRVWNRITGNGTSQEGDADFVGPVLNEENNPYNPNSGYYTGPPDYLYSQSSGDPSRFDMGDRYTFGTDGANWGNSERAMNSWAESLYNSPNTGFSPRGDIGNGVAGGGRFNQDRIPGENVGGGGGERQLTPPISTEETPPTSNDQGESNSPPYQRRPLNIPSLSILNNVPFPQFTGGVQGMPTYNTYDYPQYPQQGNSNQSYQSALVSAQRNNQNVYGNSQQGSNGMQGMFNNLWNTSQGNNQDIYRGGQNPNLSRYMPQMFDLGGKPLNNTQGQGGYSYNLPNSFGPFPQFNTNYGQGFGGMWGGMPWNQPDIYGQRLFNRQERMGQGIAVGEQNPNTQPRFPVNSKPAIDPSYGSKPVMNSPAGPIVDQAYFTGQQVDPNAPVMPMFSGNA